MLVKIIHNAKPVPQQHNKGIADGGRKIVQFPIRIHLYGLLPKAVVTHDLKTLTQANKDAKSDAADSKAASDEAQAIKQEVADAIKTNQTTFSEERVKKAETDAANAKLSATNAELQQNGVAKIQKDLTNFKPNPPIDGLLHSVQFILVYNASVTPNWSLLLWKGPGLTVPGASLSGTRTHILNIALGSPAEQNRLIQNITISNAGFH